MPRRLLLSTALVITLCQPLAAAAPSLEFSPSEWKFGMITQGSVIQQDLTVTNRETFPVTVTLVPTCSCNTVTPSTRTIAAGSTAAFHLRYDSTDDRGVTTKSFLVRRDPPAPVPVYYFLKGTIRDQQGSAPAGGAWERAQPGAGPAAAPAVSANAAPPITVTYYYTPGCRSCEEFLGVEIPRLEKSVGRRIDVVKKDLLSRGLYEELAAAASAAGQPVTAIPALQVGDTVLQGDAVIRAKLAGVLLAMSAAPAASRTPAPGAVPVPDRLAVLPVLAAGLIDGINPCAFTTLIFLLASLALAGRGRSEVLVIGALFSLAVFLTYFLIGLGFFTAFRALTAVPVISVLLRWLLVAVLVVFAGLSVYDYALIRAGRPSEMLLQLPSSFKKRIHASIRSRVRIAALAGSSLALGFLVTVFEFACTGQVYLPLLGYLARMQRQPDAIGLLALYNLCFIVPLLIVFGASWLGVTSGRITTLFQAHMGKTKLGLAVVFVGLAVFTLVG
jgi:cytochrome c biogenesis protein CcdA